MYRLLYTLAMASMNVTEFREQCLQLLDNVPPEGVLIMKRGRPVAKLLPVASSCVDLIGTIKNLSVDPKDDLLSTGLAWDAQS
jgi:antitoxin (DNA-binding transcriptional repressor) of toxin-antitoxin stability system